MTQPDKLVVSQEAERLAFNILDMEPPIGVGQLAAAFQRAMNQAADERQEMCAKVMLRRATFSQSIGSEAYAHWIAAYDAIRSIGKGGM